MTYTPNHFGTETKQVMNHWIERATLFADKVVTSLERRLVAGGLIRTLQRSVQVSELFSFSQIHDDDDDDDN